MIQNNLENDEQMNLVLTEPRVLSANKYGNTISTNIIIDLYTIHMYILASS